MQCTNYMLPQLFLTNNKTMRNNITTILLVWVLLGACSTTKYYHSDANKLLTLEPVEEPIAQMLETRFRWEADVPISPDPFSDAPGNPETSLMRVIKSGRDVAAIDGRPEYEFNLIPVGPDATLTRNDFETNGFFVNTDVNIRLSEESYDLLTAEQAEAINAWERTAASGQLLQSIAMTGLSLAREAEISTITSDAGLRRRILLESSAVSDSAPSNTKLMLYYQLVQSKKDAQGAAHQYFACTAQLHETDAEGNTLRVLDGEGFGFHNFGKFGGGYEGVPGEYINYHEQPLEIDIINDHYENPLFEYAYRSCRYAISRLAERQTEW